MSNQSTKKASNMQVPNHIHARHWHAQKSSSALSKRFEISKTGKQNPDKARNRNVVVETSAKPSELSSEFENVLYRAIYIRR